MKIIKKLCIPLLSLVLVLSCFTVSQMDASAAMSANDYIGPGSNQGGGERMHPNGILYPAEKVNVICIPYAKDTATDMLCGCSVYRDDTPTYPDNGPPYGTSGLCRNCEHSYFDHYTGVVGGPGSDGSNSHTHNYSTTWGAWRKISSCRLPG